MQLGGGGDEGEKLWGARTAAASQRNLLASSWMSNLLSAPLTWIMGEGEKGGRGGVGRPVPPPKLVKLMLEREVGAPAGIPASLSQRCRLSRKLTCKAARCQTHSR